MPEHKHAGDVDVYNPEVYFKNTTWQDDDNDDPEDSDFLDRSAYDPDPELINDYPPRQGMPKLERTRTLVLGKGKGRATHGKETTFRETLDRTPSSGFVSGDRNVNLETEIITPFYRSLPIQHLPPTRTCLKNPLPSNLTSQSSSNTSLPPNTSTSTSTAIPNDIKHLHLYPPPKPTSTTSLLGRSFSSASRKVQRTLTFRSGQTSPTQRRVAFLFPDGHTEDARPRPLSQSTSTFATSVSTALGWVWKTLVSKPLGLGVDYDRRGNYGSGSGGGSGKGRGRGEGNKVVPLKSVPRMRMSREGSQSFMDLGDSAMRGERER